MTPSPVRVYAGRVRLLPDASRSSAIAKQAVAGRVGVGRDGLAGDEQADRRVHGGPEKALHLFPADHYARLAAAFPAAAARLIPGSIGENLSVAGVDESSLCIGDVFALGSTRLQLTQARTPCWKIDAHYGVEGMTAWIAEHGCTGCYLRVIDPGMVGDGDLLTLLERPPQAPSLDELAAAMRAQRPPATLLRRLAASPGLAAAWSEKLLARAAWLEADAKAHR